MTDRLRTLLVGYGAIGASLGEDPRIRRHYRYATHADVLRDHPRFDWVGVVEPDPARRARASQEQPLEACVATPADLPGGFAADVAVLATPPGPRLALLDALPEVRGLLVEKPLGADLAAGEAFAAACRQRGVVASVNYWRRADATCRELAAGGLRRMVGAPQAVFGLYCRGLHNNGSHLVDLCRMLFGEVRAVAARGPASPTPAADLRDIDVAFDLHHARDAMVSVRPLDARYYRDVGLDIWGTGGRLSLLNEGLVVQHFPRAPNRAMTGCDEVATDAPKTLAPTVGEALRGMYDDLAGALDGTGETIAPLSSALRTAHVLEAIGRSAAAGGREEGLPWT